MLGDLMSTFEFIDVTRPCPKVMLVRLNRPQVLNAVNTAMGGELLNLFTTINSGQVDDTACVVLIGSGERAFCVGGDLKERNGMTTAQWQAQRTIFKQYNLAIERCPIPVICAVNGLALGGGAEMVLRADFAYAAEHAKFGFPEIIRGFMPGSGGTQRFARLVGEARAKELILTGEQFGSKEALAWGVVNKVFPAPDLLPACIATAEKLSGYSSDAVRTIKLCIHYGLQADIETGLVIEALGQQRLVASPDRLEGIAAFVEKRAPKWSK